MRKWIVAAIAMLSIGCMPPKFITDIPANATPARYYRTQDLPNFVAGAGVDGAMHLVFKGPIFHTGQIADSNGIRSFTWSSNDMAPVYRVGTVIALGGIRRWTDRGYRESGWLLDAIGAASVEIISVGIRIITHHD